MSTTARKRVNRKMRERLCRPAGIRERRESGLMALEEIRKRDAANPDRYKMLEFLDSTRTPTQP